MGRFLFLAVTLWYLTSFVFPGTTSACICLYPGSPTEHLRRSVAVFIGEVLSVTPDRANPDIRIFIVEFHVKDYWKGVPGSRITVRTPQSSAACGYWFLTDSTYLVYAHGEKENLWTNICTRTRTLGEASLDLAELGPPIPVQLTLWQNFPNPFNATTQIRFFLPAQDRAVLRLFNQFGREVARILEGQIGAGEHTVTWDASGFPTGVYYVSLQANGAIQKRKICLIK